ncbi:hypothetical protein Y1Q_0011925 [Alligator mississippiensis]|uniref:Uncharacterized protein n=1 Tax=Alligator mississippiensis TaxID=8496 RepID=A0A151NCE2_ALLMI|nr:hypothetical protein Y1Q_0011925 [Alligator mississippiensis]
MMWQLQVQPKPGYMHVPYRPLLRTWSADIATKNEEKACFSGLPSSYSASCDSHHLKSLERYLQQYL